MLSGQPHKEHLSAAVVSAGAAQTTRWTRTGLVGIEVMMTADDDGIQMPGICRHFPSEPGLVLDFP